MGSLPRPLSGLSRALSAFISCSRPAETELTNGLLFTAPGGAFHIAAWVISPLKVLDFFICCCPVFPSPAGLLASSGDLWRMNWTSLEYSPHLANTCNNNNCQQVDINQYYTTGRIFSYSSPPPVPPPQDIVLRRRQGREEVLQFHLQGGGVGKAHLLRICQRQVGEFHFTHVPRAKFKHQKL